MASNATTYTNLTPAANLDKKTTPMAYEEAHFKSFLNDYTERLKCASS